jgi:hypothetical protein
MRDRFYFYREWFEALKDLPRDVQLEVISAIIQCGLDGVEAQGLRPIAYSIFGLFKVKIKTEYDRAVGGIKGKEFGVRGGNPKFEKGKPNPYYKAGKGEKDNPLHNPLHNPLDGEKITPQGQKDNPLDNPSRKEVKKEVSPPAPPLKERNNTKKESSDDDKKETTFFGVFEKPVDEGYRKFCEWLKKECPFVLKVKTQMDEQQFKRLKTKYTSKEISVAVSNLNNWADFPKKRTNVYRSTLDELKKLYGERGSNLG